MFTGREDGEKEKIDKNSQVLELDVLDVFPDAVLCQVGLTSVGGEFDEEEVGVGSGGHVCGRFGAI
jgi:hypothetical protein